MNYGYLEQLKDILPGIILATFMGICVKLVRFIPVTMPLVIVLILQVITGAAIYIILSKLFKLESFGYLIDVIKSLMKKKNKKDSET